MATNYPNGLGATSGSVIATDAPFYTTGDVWYVHYGTGTDAASPRGKDDKKPLKTTTQAITNAAAGDVIVLLDGHEEPIGTGSVSLNKNLTLVGAGTSSSGLPTAKYIFDDADSSVVVTGAIVQIHNVRFGAAQAASATVRIVSTAATLFRMVDCYIECGQYDDTVTMTADTGMVWLSGVTIVSTATSATALPYVGLDIGDSAQPSSLWMDDCTFDDGDYGFSEETPFIVYDAVSAFIENLELANGADLFIGQASTLCYVNAQTVSGSGKIVFDEGAA